MLRRDPRRRPGRPGSSWRPGHGARSSRSRVTATAGLPVELMATSNTRLNGSGRSTPGAPRRSSGRTAAPPSPTGRHRRSRLRDRSRRRSPRAITLLPQRRGVLRPASCSSSPPPLRSVCCGGARPSSSDLPRALHVGPRLGRPLPLPGGQQDTDRWRRPRLVRADRRAPRGAPLPARRPPPLGALARHRPQRRADGARDGGPDRRAGHLGDPPARRPDAAERMAERAMATVVALVDRGAAVLLATTEDDGPRIGSVGDRRSAGRRLARAVAEPDTPYYRTTATALPRRALPRRGLPRRAQPRGADRAARESLRHGQARQPAGTARALDHACAWRARAR